MKYLVLGADGFLGSYFVEKLVSLGDTDVRAFGRFLKGKSRNLEHLRGKIEFFNGDFLNQNDLDKATQGVDVVLHCISLTTPVSSMNDPFIDIDTNIRGTVKLLEICVRNHISRFIFLSSGGTIYGNYFKEKFSEDDITRPISPYGISKLTIERYLEYFKINFGLDYLVFRYSNPYGLRQNLIGSQGVIPIFLNKIKNHEFITVFGNGKNVRDYIYVDDCINMSMEILLKVKLNYPLYNIASGIGISVNDIINVIENVTADKFLIKNSPSRDCDLKNVVLDNSRLFKEIGKKQLVNLEDGVRIMWNKIKSL